LYLSTADWDSQTEYGTFSIERYVLEKSELEDKEKEHLKLHQTGSKALWGGHCRNENETWLPLLEKAYAKAQGDYYSMNGGWPGYVYFGLFISYLEFYRKLSSRLTSYESQRGS
jgi:hypothetical protein